MIHGFLSIASGLDAGQRGIAEAASALRSAFARG
jgi:hypothetical protein